MLRAQTRSIRDVRLIQSAFGTKTGAPCLSPEQTEESRNSAGLGAPSPLGTAILTKCGQVVTFGTGPRLTVRGSSPGAPLASGAVLDLVLPGVDGIELMRILPGLADLPVIFVSAYGEGDTVARALEAGAADYIVKPFSAAELAARVALALRRSPRPPRSAWASSSSTGRSAGSRWPDGRYG